MGTSILSLERSDFEANLREGVGVDWPIRYQEIAPWYDYVEDFIGVSGQAEGLPQLPDGKFLPPMELNCAELVVKDAIAKYFPGERLMTIGRTAILTQRQTAARPVIIAGRVRGLHNSVLLQQPEFDVAGGADDRQGDGASAQRRA